MGTGLLQPSFSGGEIAPELYARVDLARYSTSLKTCRNFLVQPYGGVANRPGFRFIGECVTMGEGHLFGAVRLVPFQYNTAQAYVVEFGHEYARFLANGTFVESSPGVPLQISSPYASEDVFGLRFTQSADVMTITHDLYPPMELRRLSAASFEIVPYVALEGPFADLNANDAVLLWASARTGVVTLSANVDTFTPDMIGQLVYLEQRDLTNLKPWVPGERTPNFAVGALRRSDGKTYMAVTLPSAGGADWQETGTRAPIHDQGRAWDGPGDARTNGTQDWTVGVEWEYQDSGYGIVEITAVTNGTTATATVKRTLPAAVVGGPGAPAQTWTPTGNGVTKTFSISGATGTSNYDYTVTIAGVPVQSDPNNRPPGRGSGDITN